MKENTAKPTKKKRLLFWLILAACLLIAAAITVGVIFAVKGNGQDITIDGGDDITDSGNENNGGNTGNDEANGGNEKPPVSDPSDDDPKNTSSQYEFIVPVKEVNLIKSHEFAWDNTMKWYKLHEALDFAAPAGTEVMAAVDGTVTSVVTNDVLDYAVVTISHANNITTVYKFIDPDENLVAGSKVSRGQVIGKVAVANGVENADGDHLHFEVYKDGKIADPDEYLNLSSK